MDINPNSARVKRVVILHGSNTYNYGSFMMLANFIYYVEQHDREANLEFLIHCNSEEDFVRLKSSLVGYSKLKALYVKPSANRRSIVSVVTSLYNKYIYLTFKILMYKPTAVVVLGGDDLSEYYSKYNLALELFKLALLSRRTKVILVSQTIGPFSSWRVFLAGRILNKCHVFMRDPVSYRYTLDVLHLLHCELSADLALLDLPKQKEHIEKYKDFGLRKNEYVTVVISGLVDCYAQNYDVYVSSWAEIVLRMEELPSMKNKKIVLLAHVLKPDRCDDRKVIDSVYCALLDCSPGEKDRFVVITDALLPVEARSILGNGFFTISGRMHGAISSMQMGVPAICLSYGVKYQGVIGESLGMHELILEAGDKSTWNSGQIGARLLEKIEYVIQQKPALTKQMVNRVSDSKKQLNVQMRDMAILLKQ